MLALYCDRSASAVFGAFAVPGSRLLFVTFFFFVIFSNFVGLFPYVFTATKKKNVKNKSLDPGTANAPKTALSSTTMVGVRDER